MLKRLLVPTLMLAGAAMVLGPAPAAATPIPSYASSEETIKGTISSVDGKYKILVRDDRGYVDNVTLHDGTVINPTGLTLAAGQSVTVMGHNAGSTFRATEIDTPYHKDYATEAGFGYVAPYAYGYATYPYAYAYPYGYGYGYPYYGGYPGFYGSVGFYFGGGYGRGYGHGYYGHGYYGRGYGHGYSGRGYYGHGGFPASHARGFSSARGLAGGAFRGGGGHAHR